MEDEKTCAKCGKKLRKNTSFATCTEHRTKKEIQEAWRRSAEQQRLKAGAKPRAPKADADDAVLERAGLPKTPPKTDAVKRFRVVAEAMGYEPDELLAKYCEGWLAAVKESVDKFEAPGGE
jgi:hypothetical protein